MQVRVLGSSGGIGAGLRTTSLLLDDDVLIDAGTGVGDLHVHEMARLRHIFLTHSHLDHIASIPLLIDSVFDRIEEPIQVHAQPETINALKSHIFNWVIWPNFFELPTIEKPVVQYVEMAPGDIRSIGRRRIEMVAVNHSVPGVGYRVECETGAFAFSGDTTTNDNFWTVLNGYDRLDLLIVESAFANHDEHLARLAAHYCPSLLAQDLAKLRHDPDIYISHPKPGEEGVIIEECRSALRDRRVSALNGSERFVI